MICVQMSNQFTFCRLIGPKSDFVECIRSAFFLLAATKKHYLNCCKASKEGNKEGCVCESMSSTPLPADHAEAINLSPGRVQMEPS